MQIILTVITQLFDYILLCIMNTKLRGMALLHTVHPYKHLALVGAQNNTHCTLVQYNQILSCN